MESKNQRGGRRPGAGRKAGVPNRLSASVKEAITAAFDEAGGHAYLVGVAKSNPAVFCHLLGKILPLQLTGEDGEAIKHEVTVIKRVIIDARTPT